MYGILYGDAGRGAIDMISQRLPRATIKRPFHVHVAALAIERRCVGDSLSMPCAILLAAIASRSNVSNSGHAEVRYYHVIPVIPKVLERLLMPSAVLIVDDDEDIREVVRALLEDEGYHVEEARQGEEALRILKKSPHRFVVLLDLRMPVLDGLGVVSAIAGDSVLRHRHVYILVTADNRTLPLSFVQQLTTLEIPVLPKPFEEHKLFALVAHSAARLAAQSN